MNGLRYKISKFIKPDRFIYNVKPFIYKDNIGNLDFTIKDKQVILDNVYINENYRRNKYGSFFLEKMENYVKKNYQSKSIRLLSYYQPVFESHVLSFFKKNGYVVTYKNAKIFENGQCYEDIYYIDKKI